MRDLKASSLPALAALICDACLKQGLDVVLSGGACVSIYTRNRYASFDLDFVLRSPVSRRRVKKTMEELGFREDGRHFRHPDTRYIVEFLQPPLSVGEEPVRDVREIRSGDRILRLLSPTDCVKDRLAAYFHWNDLPSLEQAILVCRKQDVDLRQVGRWAAAEGMKDKFDIFRGRVARTKRGK
jgi:hypothetical protein